MHQQENTNKIKQLYYSIQNNWIMTAKKLKTWPLPHVELVRIYAEFKKQNMNNYHIHKNVATITEERIKEN